MNTLNKTLICLTLTLLTACQPQTKPSTATATPTQAPKPQAASKPPVLATNTPAPSLLVLPKPSQDQSTLECGQAIRGLPLNQLQNRYGSPTRTETVQLDQGLHEFQVGLHNHYPPKDPKSKGVTFLEHWYNYGDYHGIIWYHKVDNKWVGLDALTWLDGVEF